MLKFVLALVIGSYVLTINGHDPDMIIVDNFENYIIGSFPEEWNGRKRQAKKYYKISKDTQNVENHFLSAHSINSDMFIIKKMKVDLVAYPYLNWRWRARIIPTDGNETIKNRCDVAASVNVVLVAVRWMPRTIKYSWSSSLPINTISKSPFAKWPSRTDIVVRQSGADRKGLWINEKVNVLEDYKKLYKKDEVESYYIDAIVLMSDSDNTVSESAADYDDIYFSKN